VTLLAYESFTVPEDAFAEFTAETGIAVDIALGGDSGELTAKVALTSGNPEGDVLWGVDNALVTRLVETDAFDPYVSLVAPIDQSLLESGLGMVTPVDFGFVCVNYDVAAFDTLGLEPPMNLDDLIKPEYRGMLVVPDATASSPGFAFVLATVSAFPETWSQYWQQLIDNDVAIASDWTDAYYTQFTRHGGERPLVVSYSTSPPAEVILSDPPLDADAPAPTGVVEDTCFQQIEFAGVLRGSDNVDAARALVDFLVGRGFQELLPENLFVYPVNRDASLPDSFVRYAEPVSEPWTLSSEDIARRRVEILDEWLRRVQQ
jgi:thiamine transport system substrate-binding protein